MKKQNNLDEIFGIPQSSRTTKSWGQLQDKFWNNPEYEWAKNRFEEISRLMDKQNSYDLLTTVVSMNHGLEEEKRQGIIPSGDSKELLIDRTGMDKKSAYNIGGFQKKVIVNGTNIRVSSFPEWLTQGYVYFFTDKGDTILDPFSGHNSRGTAVVKTGRNYIGYDVAKYYTEIIQEQYDKIKDNDSYGKLTINWQSSEKMNEPDESVDFIFTSPPFWNVEVYDNDPRQLGGRLDKPNEVSYEEFLDGYKRVIKECYRVLKYGHHIGFNVEDIRKNNKLYLFGYDTIRIFQEVGFEITDIVITPYTSVAKSFKIQKVISQHFGKSHGYIIIGKK